MGSDFATKLRLTTAVLGCSSRKELCARFRAANPATHFDLERSHKWLQGRALPRSGQVYEDWAKVLGTQRPGAWLASCTVDAFLGEICALYDADAAALRLRAEVDAPGGSDRAPPAGQHRADRAYGYLYGTYACYSMAWSPYHRGQVIRGALLFQPGSSAPGGKAAPLVARYTEGLLGEVVLFEGEALFAGRTLHLLVRSSRDGAPLFLSLFLPGPPASVLCGVMSGATIVGPEPRPSAVRVAMIRVPADASGTNRYMQLTPEAIAEDLAALGVPSAPAGVGTLIRDFLLGNRSNEGLEQVSASDQTRFASALDLAYLGTG